MIYELHPLCTLFPRMSGTEFAMLVDDIRTNGLLEPIIVHEGMILDGGNRYFACMEAGVVPRTKEFDGDNPVAYVLSANLHRRHLPAGQAAAIVASAQNWDKAHPSHRTGKEPGNLTPLSTRTYRAALSGVSDGTQKMADKVAKADPELAKAVGRGEISLPKAVEKITGKCPGTKRNPEPALQVNEEEYNPEDDIVAELKDVVRTLAAENDALKDRIATGVMEGTEEEKRAAVETIGSLRKEVDVLRKTLDATEATRDIYQCENGELKNQLKRQRAVIERLERRDAKPSTIPDRHQAANGGPTVSR